MAATKTTRSRRERDKGRQIPLFFRHNPVQWLSTTSRLFLLTRLYHEGLVFTFSHSTVHSTRVVLFCVLLFSASTAPEVFLYYPPPPTHPPTPIKKWVVLKLNITSMALYVYETREGDGREGVPHLLICLDSFGGAVQSSGAV